MTVYICQDCGTEKPRISAPCPGCGAVLNLGRSGSDAGFDEEQWRAAGWRLRAGVTVNAALPVMATLIGSRRRRTCSGNQRGEGESGL